MKMQPLADDLREFIEKLNFHKVRYLVVGGYAVAYHGYPRMTGDIDFFVEASEENAGKLEAVLNAFGFASVGITAQDFLGPDIIIQLGYPPNRIDLITSLSGVAFATAWPSRIKAEIYGISAFIIDKQSLIANKQAAGRAKDLLDVKSLRTKTPEPG